MNIFFPTFFTDFLMRCESVSASVMAATNSAGINETKKYAFSLKPTNFEDLNEVLICVLETLSDTDRQREELVSLQSYNGLKVLSIYQQECLRIELEKSVREYDQNLTVKINRINTYTLTEFGIRETGSYEIKVEYSPENLYEHAAENSSERGK